MIASRRLPRILLGIVLSLAVAGPTAPGAALAQPAAGKEGEAEETSEARADRLKREGDAAMDSLRYAEALDLYTRAYEVGKNPAVLYNRGRAFEALRKFPEALDEILKFRSSAPPELLEKVPKLHELVAELRGKVSSLRVTSSVPGSRVVVRSEVIGRTPLPGPFRLNAGSAVVEVTADGYYPFRKRVVLPGGGDLTVKAVLRTRSTCGILRVDSPVAGATAVIDGRSVGKVPAERAVRAGKHRVLVRADGYEDAATSAVVVAGERQVVRVRLEKTPSILSRWWFWTGAGVVVAGGVAATIALLTEGPADEGDIPPGRVSAPLLGF